VLLLPTLWNFVGEAAYVGTRQVNQLGVQEQNWAPIGGGSAGRQLVQKYGRTAPTLLIAPLGNSHYNGLQTRLSRRFRNGVQFNFARRNQAGVLTVETPSTPVSGSTPPVGRSAAVDGSP
jgi:hypothetical protein